MNSHRKKKIAPILVTVLLLIYFALYFGILISLIPSVALKIVVGVVPLLLGSGVILVCIQRIKEINGGEEDDLSKY